MHAIAIAFLKKGKMCVHAYACTCALTRAHAYDAVRLKVIYKLAFKYINFHVASRFLDLL